MWDGDDVDLAYEIRNADRAIGASLSGAIALEYGELPPRGTARVRFTGTAGQSFAAFLAHGVELDLTGEANDYVGKGMGGGVVVIRRPENDASELPVLAGNTCLYGATGGELYVAGGVGERFGVRNSGATAVVEATGDHCCEYMTGGTIVVLGPVGCNLGAGMTGGQAYVFDRDHERLISRLNPDLVDAVRPGTSQPRRGALAGRAPRRADRFAAVGPAARALGQSRHPPVACPAERPGPPVRGRAGQQGRHGLNRRPSRGS